MAATARGRELCIAIALASSGVPPAQAPPDPCDPAIARRAEEGPSGYQPRKGELGDARCEGLFRVQVAEETQKTELLPIGCWVALVDLGQKQELVSIVWPWTPGQVVLLRATPRSGIRDKDFYRMDAADGPQVTPELSDPPRGVFRWDMRLARGLDLDLNKLAILAWLDRPVTATAHAGKVLLPLAINVPEPASTPNSAPPQPECGETARLILLLSPTRIVQDGEITGRWTPAARDDPGIVLPAAIRPQGNLLLVDVDLPADGNDWILELFVQYDHQDPEAVAPIHVRAPTREFISWARRR